jgi:hypothetical protein
VLRHRRIFAVYVSSAADLVQQITCGKLAQTETVKTLLTSEHGVCQENKAFFTFKQPFGRCIPNFFFIIMFIDYCSQRLN